MLEWVAIYFSRWIFPTQESNPGLPHKLLRKTYQLGTYEECISTINLINVHHQGFVISKFCGGEK